jgi:ATP-dependent DNA helicase RecG
VSVSGEIANPVRSDKLEKISATAYTQAYMARGYKGATVQYLKEIYDQLEVNQVFGSAYLVKILECSDKVAQRLLAKLREMDVVIAVAGKGKGMYRLKSVGE